MTDQKKTPPACRQGGANSNFESKGSVPAGGSQRNSCAFRFGAAPDDWDHFDMVLGLTEDLLPVVSNPNAEISEYSKVKEPGKTPSDYNRQGKMRGLKDWTSKKATPSEISAWKKVPDYGICLQTRVVRAIDVDISDPEESAAVRAFLNERLSVKLPCRGRANSSKFLLAFTMPGDFQKHRFSTRTPGNAIEFLATGQQFVAIGTHPSGVRYEWEGGLPNDIPELDPAEYLAIRSALFENFGSGEIAESKRGITPAKKRQLSDMNDPLVDFLDDRGWIKDIARDGRVDITCPWEHEHTSDSSDSSTSYFASGIGGFERGHFQCLHSHCAGRTDQDFFNEIGWTTHGFEVIEDRSDEPDQIRIQVRNALRGEERTAENRLDRSDTANVNLIHAYSQGRLKYLAERDHWLVWTGARWEVDATKNGLQRYCRMVGEHYHEDAAQQRKAADNPSIPADDRKRLHKVADSVESWAVQCRNHQRIVAMQAQAKMDPRFILPMDKLDADPYLLGAQNGVIDLRTGRLMPDGREQYITRRARVDFDPGAKAVRWLKFIEEITAQPIPADVDDSGNVIAQTVGRYTPRPEYARYLQKALGYSVCGLTSEQKMFICSGEGGNGKNIVLDMLKWLLPDVVDTATPALLLASSRSSESNAPSPDVASLAGLRMIVASETKAGARLDTAVVKAHTGNRYLRARFLNSNPVTFEVTHKIWLMTNHRPRIDDLDVATRSRLHILPFEMRWNRPGEIQNPHLPTGDKGLDSTLRAEATGILAWLVEGAALYFAEGLEPPRVVSDCTTEYFEDQDSMKHWLRDFCEPCDVVDGSKPAALFGAYVQFCREEGLKQQHQNQIAFSKALGNAQFVKKISGGVTRYNLRLRNEEGPLAGMPVDDGDDLC